MQRIDMDLLMKHIVMWLNAGGKTYYCTTSENVWGGNTANTKCAQSMP